MHSNKIIVLCLGIVSFVCAQPSLRYRGAFSLPNSTLSRTVPSTSTPVTVASSRSPTSSSQFSKSSSFNVSTSAMCCFVVQDTISEEWWQEYDTTSTHGLVNLTAITTYVTQGPNGTTLSSTSTVTLTNTSFVFSYNVGVNPLATLSNAAPGPTETNGPLTGSATMTGGVLVQSPAAFYVYNSVKIITAAAITDNGGNVMCGTAAEFPNMNSNAEAYFGGASISREELLPISYTTVITTTLTFVSPTPFTITPTMTRTLTSYSPYYINSAGNTITPTVRQAGSVISLTTPFIYQPPWGAAGGSEPTGACARGDRSEQYGYIPQTLLDYLVHNPAYSAQYTGLAGCLPAGPSIIFNPCVGATRSLTASPLPSTIAIPAGGGLTSATTIYVNPNVQQTPTSPHPQVGDTSINTAPPSLPAALASPPVNPQASPSPTPNPLQNADPNNALGQLGTIRHSEDGGPFVPVLTIPIPTTIPLAGAPPNVVGITQIIDNTPVVVIPSPTTFSAATSGQLPLPGPSTVNIGGSSFLIIPASTNIPLSEAPPGLRGSTVVIEGTSMIVVPQATFVANPPPNPNVNQQEGIFSTQVIGGSPVLVIPGPTNIPLSQAPPGLRGSTTVVDGTTFLSVPSATTLPNPSSNSLQNPGGIFSSSIVEGSTVLVIPQTTIPLIQAPPGLQGSTTVISGSTFLVVPSATQIALPNSPSSPFQETTINNTPVLIIPSATEIPLSQVPAGLTGKTTLISGSLFLVIPSATTVPLPLNPTSTGAVRSVITTLINGTPYLLIPSPSPPQLPGILTTVSGTPELVVGPTTLPASELSGLGVSGRTTVIGGTTEVVLSSGTTIGLPGIGSSTQSVGEMITTVTSIVVTSIPSPQETTTKKNNAGQQLDTDWWKAGFLCILAVALALH